jgi:serine/threonine protein phosphatase PrpC
MKKLELKLQIKEALPKVNESPSDCQDSLAANVAIGLFAVADGVASTFYPAEWSKLLVDQFCYDNSRANLDLFQTQNWREWLLPIQDKWYSMINEKVSKKTGIDSLHLRNSLISRDPAASTFVGLQINADNNNQGNQTWQAMLIGDSCLFHFSNGKFTSQLMRRSQDFDYHPQYFSSIRSTSNNNPTFLKGKFEIGDVFVLATDKLAEWILVQYEKGEETWNKTWQALMNIKNYRELFTFVTNARENTVNPMEDDDVALIVLSCTESKDKSSEIFEEPVHLRKELADKKLQALEPAPRIVLPPAAPINQTPGKSYERVTNKKVDTKRVQYSALPLVALFISIISLLVSLTNFYLFLKRNNIITTVSSIPTSTKLQPRQEILPSNTVLYISPDNQSQIAVRSQSGMQVLIVEQRGNWYRIQATGWVMLKQGEAESVGIQDNLIITQKELPIYSSPSITPIPIGVVSQGITVTKLDEYTDNNATWYHIQLEGFFQGNKRW